MSFQIVMKERLSERFGHGTYWVILVNRLSLQKHDFAETRYCSFQRGLQRIRLMAEITQFWGRYPSQVNVWSWSMPENLSRGTEICRNWTTQSTVELFSQLLLTIIHPANQQVDYMHPLKPLLKLTCWKWKDLCLKTYLSTHAKNRENRRMEEFEEVDGVQVNETRVRGVQGAEMRGGEFNRKRWVGGEFKGQRWVVGEFNEQRWGGRGVQGQGEAISVVMQGWIHFGCHTMSMMFDVWW